MDSHDTKALLSVMGSLHKCIREPKVRIGCETHASNISQGKPRSETFRYMDDDGVLSIGRKFVEWRWDLLHAGVAGDEDWRTF